MSCCRYALTVWFSETPSSAARLAIPKGLPNSEQSGCRIFVSIASFRDPETRWTVHDLLTKASRPARLRIGIVWQVDATADAEFLEFPSSVNKDQVLSRISLLLGSSAEALPLPWVALEASIPDDACRSGRSSYQPQKPPAPAKHAGCRRSCGQGRITGCKLIPTCASSLAGMSTWSAGWQLLSSRHSLERRSCPPTRPAMRSAVIECCP